MDRDTGHARLLFRERRRQCDCQFCQVRLLAGLLPDGQRTLLRRLQPRSESLRLGVYSVLKQSTIFLLQDHANTVTGSSTIAASNPLDVYQKRYRMLAVLFIF